MTNAPPPVHHLAVAEQWPRHLASVGRARHRLCAVLTGWGLAALAEPAVLVLSELMTNSLTHARESSRGRIGTCFVSTGCGIRIEVHDASASPPRMRAGQTDDEHGRGLVLVDALTAGRWGADFDESGKTVWALLGEEPHSLIRFAPAPLPACGEHAELSEGLVVVALGLAVPGVVVDPPDVDRELRCVLQAHTRGDHHALAAELPGRAGGVWTWWNGDHGPDALAVRPDCPATAGGDACCAYATHSGAHTYDLTDPWHPTHR